MLLNHLHLKAKHPEKLIRFYSTYFDLKILDQNSVETYLGNPSGTWLTISLFNEQDRTLPDWFHFGFCLSSKKEVQDLYLKMKQNGLSFSRELTSFGEEGVSFYVLDPEGNKVEISWIRARQ